MLVEAEMSAQPTPFVLVGDLLGQPTGLSRILTDLATRLYAEREALGIDVRVVGWVNWADLPHHGTSCIVEVTDIKCWAFHDLTAWGRGALTTAYRQWFGDRPGIVLTIWDAHRCFGLTDTQIPVKWWGYVPVDGVNVNGEVGGGPVREALARYSRLLAYTDFGSAAILKTLIDAAPYKVDPVVAHLPHGLNMEVFSPNKVQPAALVKMGGIFVRGHLLSSLDHIIGCVATNQPRKDWGLVAATLAELRRRGHNLHGWWHCDAPVSDAWSLPQLAEDFGLEESVTITTRLTDYELAAAYTCCVATIAPGRGEGFCYPIAESLAMGTPVVHADYAGGAEFTPAAWRLPVEAYHLEGAYGVRRPIVSPVAAADALEGILTGAVTVTPNREKVATAVKDLDWTVLWPRWSQWIREGL